MPELVALQAMLPQIDSPDALQAKAFKIQQMQAAQQQAQAEMQARQLALQDDQGTRAAFAANPTDGAARLSALAGVSPKAYASEAKQQSELAKTGAETSKAQLEASRSRLDLAGQAFGYVRNNPTPDNALQAIKWLTDNGVYTPEQAQQYAAKVQAEPGRVKEMADMAFSSALDAKDQLAKIETRDTGGQVQTIGIDPVTGKATTLSDLAKTQSPDNAASVAQQDRSSIRSAASSKYSADSSAATARARLNYDKTKDAGGEDSAMEPLTVRTTAQQYLAGDGTALANIGRGAQGAKNLVLVRNEIARQANSQGLNGADIAAKMAEFQGMKAGNRTLGTRTANIEIAAAEAAELAPLALEASAKVARSGLLPFGKAQVMFDSQTNDPNLRQFAMANNALVNAFGQVMSRGGVATVSDKEHARELLSTAFDQPSYAKAVEQLNAEIRAAQKAPNKVRKEMSAAASGRDAGHGQASAPAAPKAGSVVDGYRFKGGDPSKQSSWEKQ